MLVMHGTWRLLLPELRRFAPGEQDAALERARDTPADVAELVGMACAVVAVTLATQYSLADSGLLARFAGAGLNFAIALPLLALGVGPFHLRRLRRGLRRQLESRSAHE